MLALVESILCACHDLATNDEHEEVDVVWVVKLAIADTPDKEQHDCARRAADQELDHLEHVSDAQEAHVQQQFRIEAFEDENDQVAEDGSYKVVDAVVEEDKQEARDGELLEALVEYDDVQQVLLGEGLTIDLVSALLRLSIIR